jgi:hypothetical protein
MRTVAFTVGTAPVLLEGEELVESLALEEARAAVEQSFSRTRQESARRPSAGVVY